MKIRLPAADDEAALAEMRFRLWPEASRQEHRDETHAFLAGAPLSTLPLANLVAEMDGTLVGFVEVGLRSHADGCDPTRPCGFLEGWYVEPSHRRKGIGRALVAAAEDWCRSLGATEMASDADLANEASHHAHTALGFTEVERVVKFHKRLR